MNKIKLFNRDFKVNGETIQEKATAWSYKRSFYGNKKTLNKQRVNELINNSYLNEPFTIYDDWFKSISLVGYDIANYSNVKKPFPDLLLSQKPKSKFALHLSGGIDSCLLALLYDSEQVDYFTVTVEGSSDEEYVSANEFLKSKKLKGKHHHIIISPEKGLQIAKKILPILKEPYMDPAIVLSYAASKKAKEMGHHLIVAGDGADLCFGLPCYPDEDTLSMTVWKTIEPAEMLGLQALLPYKALDLVNWGKNYISQAQRQNKVVLKDFAKSVGMPNAILNKRKEGWVGHERWCAGKVYETMKQEINDSPFSKVLGDETTWSWSRQQEIFRQYSVIKWLEHNCDDKISIVKGFSIKDICNPSKTVGENKWSFIWMFQKFLKLVKERRLPNVPSLIRNYIRERNK